MTRVPLRIGVVGLVHDHVWGVLRGFAECGRAEVVAAADPNPPLLDKIAQDCGVEAGYAEYAEMLSGEDLDAVLCYTENSRHAEVVEACAAAGLHVMCEKPMADHLANADRMLAAARGAGIKLMISYPSTWQPALHHARQLVEEGAIGQVCQLRDHHAHAGPKEIGCSEYFYSWLYDASKNGAGALMDYCCYGAKICTWFLGKPNSVIAMAARLYKDYIDVEDNAFILMSYDSAYGIAEASWTQIGPLPEHGPVINGSTGTIIVRRGELWLATTEDKEGRTIQSPELPAHWRTPAEYFSWCLLEDVEPEGPTSAQLCRDAQEILEAGILSVERDARVELPLPSL